MRLYVEEPVVIVPSPDGPYLVRGPVELRDQLGRRVHLTRTPIALCRCGRSQTRPFCDGTHQLIGFRAPSEPESEVTSAVMRPDHEAEA
jgi:CDGSH-type Zn-finger protein